MIDGVYHIVASAPGEGYIAVWKLDRQLDLTGETTTLEQPLQTVSLKPTETANNNAAPAAGAPAAAAAGANRPAGQNDNAGPIDQHPECWSVTQLIPLPQGLLAFVQYRGNPRAGAIRSPSPVMRVWTWDDFFTKGGRGAVWDPLGPNSSTLRVAANESRTLVHQTTTDQVRIYHTADIFAYASAIYPKIHDGNNLGAKSVRANAMTGRAPRLLLTGSIAARDRPAGSQQTPRVPPTAAASSTGAAATNVTKPKVQGTIRRLTRPVLSLNMYNDLAALCMAGGTVVVVDLLTTEVLRKFTIPNVNLRYAILGPDSLHLASSNGKVWAYYIQPSGPASRRRVENLRTSNAELIEKTRLENPYGRYY
eukprot:TRINITY_DN9227_c0_g1_i1.p1 TRINITY_DN9227_c0_g1~~TRINITY_DN9227_c0_g1_i1.p1  ORF type:complete len:365 (-),score=47.29 TRINITY_DN9227_c0_g1_i1:150-1244(-)